MSSCCTTPAFEPPAAQPPAGSIRTLALIGPPNSGKSTLFNRLTGLRQKVANYPGVTVEQRMGVMAGVGREDLTLIDLPGVYSLTPYSEDARVSIDVLKGNMPGTPKPEAVLLVLDALHLTRQLMLAAPVLALGLPTLVLLNMSDLMESRGGKVDTLKLGARARRAGCADQRNAWNGPRMRFPLFLNQHRGDETGQPLTLPVLGQRGEHALVGGTGDAAHGVPGAAVRGKEPEAGPDSAASHLGTATLPDCGGGRFRGCVCDWPTTLRWIRQRAGAPG